MGVNIFKDTEGNSYFRSLDIPIGLGTVSIRVVDREAEEVAKRIMEVDLTQHIAEVKTQNPLPRTEREFREVVVRRAVDGIRLNLREERVKENSGIYHDGLG